MPADLRYPVGRFEPPAVITPDVLTGWIDDIAALPADLRAVAEALPDLERPYRPGGWTARQVVHHVPDSHINAYVRFKRALTEHAPRITAYDEAAWAELPDSRASIGGSLDLLAALHARWTGLMREMTPADWARTFVHPVSGEMRLDRTAGMYAWHGRHHLAHLRLLGDR